MIITPDIQFELKIENISFNTTVHERFSNKQRVYKKQVFTIKVIEEIKHFSRIFNSIFFTKFSVKEPAPNFISKDQ